MLRTGCFAFALALGLSSWDTLSAFLDLLSRQNIPWTDSNLHG